MRPDILVQLLFVGIGGFAGAILRHLVSAFFVQRYVDSKFPLGIFAVNIAGSFLIGFLAGIIENKELLSNNMKLLVFTGLLGAFTTFSTFSKDTYDLFVAGYAFQAVLNILLSVSLGLFSVWLGLLIAGKF